MLVQLVNVITFSLTCFPADRTQKPGPGAHSPEKCQISYRKAPTYSLGVRHSEYMCPLIIDVSD